MVALWYLGFSVLLSLPIAAPISLMMERSIRGKLASILIAVVIMHLVGVIIGFTGPMNIEIPLPR